MLRLIMTKANNTSYDLGDYLENFLDRSCAGWLGELELERLDPKLGVAA